MNGARRVLVVSAVLGSLMLSAPCQGRAQSVHQIDPSVSAAGMGRVATAVFWEPASASWENPAILGYQRGVRYARGRTQWLFGVDTWFTTNRVAVGAYGVGILLAGRPLDGLGGHRYHSAGEIDGSYGTFPYHDEQEANTIAFGVSILEFTSHILPGAHDVFSRLKRFGDLSVGLALNDIESVSTLGGGTLHTDAATKDYGFLVRLTPYNSVDSPEGEPISPSRFGAFLGGIRADASYGYSGQNFEDAVSHCDELDNSYQLTKYTRHGGAIRLATGLPNGFAGWLDGMGMHWLAGSLAPLVSWGFGWEREKRTHFFGGENTRTHEEHGWEVTIANILTLRRGEIDDPGSGLDGPTSGWGLGLKFGNIGGFRYDEATVPNTIFGNELTRKGFVVYVGG